MTFLRWILFFLLCLSNTYAYEMADTKFEVSKVSSTSLQVKVFENQTLIFDQIVNGQEEPFGKTFGNPMCQMQREYEGFSLRYQGIDKTSLALFISYYCNITILMANKTNYQQRKTWGFKTPEILINKCPAAFYKAFTHTKEFHNYGIFKTLTSELHQDYLFNKGILHFGDETDYAGTNAYSPYLWPIHMSPQPNYESGIIDDYGIILAEHGLKITGLTHRSHNYTDIGDRLELQNASIENSGKYNVSGPITGVAQRIENKCFFSFGSMRQSTFSLGEWVNKGEVYVQSSSQIFAQELMYNSYLIYTKGDIGIGSWKRSQSFGPIFAEGEIKVIVQRRINESEFQEAFKDSGFFSKSKEVVVDSPSYTYRPRHPITDRHLIGDFREHNFPRQIETGCLFQPIITMEQPKEVEIGSPEYIKAIEGLGEYLGSRCKFSKDLRDKFKDRLKILGKVSVDIAFLLDTITTVLRDADLDGTDISSILGDEELSGFFSSFALYDDKSEAIDETKFFQKETLYSELIKNVVAQSQISGLSTVQWIQRNGVEFVSGLCDLVTSQPTSFSVAMLHAASTIGIEAHRSLLKASSAFNTRSESAQVRREPSLETIGDSSEGENIREKSSSPVDPSDQYEEQEKLSSDEDLVESNQVPIVEELVEPEPQLDDISEQVWRGRSLQREDSRDSSSQHSPERLLDCYGEHAARAVKDAIDETYSAKERVLRGQGSSKDYLKAAGAYGLDGLAWVSEGLDTATFGLWGTACEALDQGIDKVATGIRRGVRYATDDPGLGQDFGDGAKVFLNLVSPGKLSKAKTAGRLAHEAETLGRVARESEAVRGLDLAQALGKDQPWTVRPGQEWKAKVFGKAHGTTPGHKFRSYREALKMVKSGDYKSVHVNQWLKTSTGVDVEKNFIPDVLGVRQTRKADIVEVASKTDKPKALHARAETALSQLPLEMRGTKDVVSPTKGLQTLTGKQ